jgi:type IV pilus assembly protein PilC
VSTYAFRAVDIAGSPSRGQVDASSKSQVTEQLRQKGLVVLDVEEIRDAFKIEDIWKRWRRVKGRNLAVFSRQFATLIASGMPMLRSLYTLEDQTEDELLKESVVGIRQDVEAGASVSVAMERHPKVFDKLFVAMVRSGENSGRLEEALDRVAYQLEKLDALKRQVRSALLYPTIVLAFAAVVLTAIVAFVVPVFVGIYKDIAQDQPGTDTSLPKMTQITVGASNLVTHRAYILVIAIAIGVWAFRKWKRTEVGRDQWDTIKLRLPVKIGDVVQKVALARWSRTFSGLITAGVPLLQSIEITGQTSGNTKVEKAMDDVYASVKRGGSVAAPIAAAEIFPSMVGHMVAVGEDTGALEHMLTKIADFYEAEVEAKVKALTSIIEPALLMIVGGVVGFIVISMYLPIFDIYNKIK